MTTPAEFLASLPVGTRVVVRRRIEGGWTDSLGDLIACDGASCTVRTRRGDDVVPMADVDAAKSVPPPPDRRTPRR